jgi:O-antigen/teichoic acid export membrane protein
LGLLAGFAVLYIVVQAQGGLPLLLATSMGGPIAGNLILLLLLIARGQLSFSGILRGIRSEPGHLTRVGGLFFILQIGTMVGWGADSIIISSALGPAAVAAYAVTKRLMMLVTVPLSIMNSPLWAAYADAHARSAKEFIRKTLYRSLGVSLLYSLPIALALVVFGDFVIDYWTSGKIEVPTSLLLAFCAFAVVEALGNAFAMFLNGVGVVKEQVYIVCVFVLLVLPLKLLAVESHGALGVVVAGLGVYLLVHIAGYSIFWRRIMDRFI